ncbi:MAG TPA: hypothetical protein VFC24_07420 [Casimicrobiaceae bacterium]|nr:hypothetical protein [Casimicrobiaceae bacterium]
MKPLTLLLLTLSLLAHAALPPILTITPSPPSPAALVLPPIARLATVFGDRQIVVWNRAGYTYPAPIGVRATDVAGNPVPGAVLVIETSSGPTQIRVTDEFGFRGFNAPSGFAPTGSGADVQWAAITNSDGIAANAGQILDFPPAAVLVLGTVGIGIQGTGYVPPARASLVLVNATPQGIPSVVVEYFHEPTHHYFNTIDDNEIAALDRGEFAGWTRSIGAFIGYKSAQAAPAGAVPVCRFFSPQFTSHFFTANSAECDAVIARWPDVWQLETRTAFYINVPDPSTGTCAIGFQPVYRLFNNRVDGNHRYVTDRSLRDRMVGAGWLAEGFGPDAVAMCTPG